MNMLRRDVAAFFNTISQIKELLSRKQQLQALGVFVLILFGTALETLGIAAILPFIYAVMSPQQLWKNEYIQIFARLFHFESDIALIIFLGAAIGAVYLLKNLFLLFTAYVQARFRSRVAYEMAKLMLHSYLKRPYLYFLSTNSAEMMRGVNEDINSVGELVDCLFKIFSLCLMIIGIGIFLIAQDPVMALGIMILAAVIFLLIMLTIKKKTKNVGILKRDLAAQAYQYAYQAISGIKEIIIMNREDHFLKSYTGVMSRKRKADVIYSFISACPDRIVEGAFVIGIMAIICLQVMNGQLSDTFLPNLAVFAVGAMRILPSLSTLTSRMAQLVYLRPALNAAGENVKAAKQHEAEIMERKKKDGACDEDLVFSEKIEVRNITWKYPNSETCILKDANMSIERGQAIAFIGKSGAGKTTLADILLGLLKPQSGSVYMDGMDIFSIPQAWSRMVGYVPQSVYMIDDNIRNNVSFGIDQREVDDQKVWRALEEAQLKEFVEQLPGKLDTVIGERGIKFSGGQRQRIAIARALYHNPSVLVFDEATAALDGETEQAVMEAIEELQGNKTLIIIAHRLNTIRNCDRFFAVENGKIVEKQYDEVFKE